MSDLYIYTCQSQSIFNRLNYKLKMKKICRIVEEGECENQSLKGGILIRKFVQRRKVRSF
jgi:hypothetical protein